MKGTGASAPAYHNLPYHKRLGVTVGLYISKCTTETDRKNFFMYRRLLMNHEPVVLDAIHDYMTTLDHKDMPLWTLAKEAEAYRTRKIFEESRRVQKEMQKGVREEHDLQKLLRGE